jgi:predicted HTH transcriptional regulator
VPGAGPVIEIYQDRIEISNPGSSLIEVDRIIDERQSRNQKFAAAMREIGLCEERGGGIDKAIIDIEEMSLPAPEFLYLRRVCVSLSLDRRSSISFQKPIESGAAFVIVL